MYVKACGKPVFDANGEFRGYRGTGADVTATMHAQEEHERLRQLESDLAHMNRLSIMGESAASLVHEITQPIATARNNARGAGTAWVRQLTLSCGSADALQRIGVVPSLTHAPQQRASVSPIVVRPVPVTESGGCAPASRGIRR
jgi:hypothetical protein